VRRTHNGLRLESRRLLGDESAKVNWILCGDLEKPLRGYPQHGKPGAAMHKPTATIAIATAISERMLTRTRPLHTK